MKIKKLSCFITITILFSIVMVMSCTSKSNNSAAPNVSFRKDLLPIFEASCAINSSCHVGASNLNDNVDLSDSMAYSTITSKGLVYPSSPAASILYNQVATGAMPKDPYAKLSAAQKDLILNWIQQGAKNN